MERPWFKFYDPGVPPNLTYPTMPLYDLLDRSASRLPNQRCINFFGKFISYQRVKELSDSFAASLLKLGIQKGDRVALLMPNSPQFVIGYYGILKAGAIVVALNPMSSARELTYQLEHSGSETIITIPLFLSNTFAVCDQTSIRRIIYSRLADFMPLPLNILMMIRENREICPRATKKHVELLDFRSLTKQKPLPSFSPEPVDPQEMAVLIYSGGTTGTAKGIMLSHMALVANALQVQAWGQLTEEVRVLSVLPLFHGYGMSVNMNAILLSGGEMILVPRFNAKQVAKTIQKYQPNFLTAVPTMFVALSNIPDIQRYDLSSLQGIFVGAAPLTRAIKDNFENKTGGRMIEGYGLTEAVTAIMANPYKGLHKVGSIGIPFPDVDVKIVSLDGEHDLPPLEQGEIVLRSPTLMLGYYKQPEETHNTIKDGWLFTGDIGYMDNDGYFYITDRKKDLIIVGGFNVFPREIDELIYQHPKVKEGICIGLPDPYKGERIKVYIVLKDGETATEEEFIAYFRQNLTPYKVPSEVEFRSELPKSMIGKILRKALREEEARKVAERNE